MTEHLPNRIVTVTEPGGPGVLQVVQRNKPKPGPGEVLIRNAACGVNRPDQIERLGFYPAPPGAPEGLGLEVSGNIEAVGEDVSGWAPGDAVCALVAGGGYADYSIAPQGSVLAAPDRLDLVDTAGRPETAFTVFANVFEAGGLLQGETFLVHGGTSGIGTTAIQMAKAAGATVIATAGTAEKCALCETLGADRAINYRDEDYEAIARELGGVDVLLDMVGGTYVQKNINVMKPRGRIISIAFLTGSRVEIDLMPVMLKRLVLTGSTLRPQSVESKARIAKALEAQVLPLISAGKIGPKIYKTFPLAQAAEAHALMESSAHMGKIMLEV